MSNPLDIDARHGLPGIGTSSSARRKDYGVKLLALALSISGLSSCATTQVLPAPSLSGQAAVEYPSDLRGAWMPKEIGCETPINFDSESLLLIEASMLGQYENTSKPLRIEQLSSSPRSWRIAAAIGDGTGEYDGEEQSTFTMDGSKLSIEHGNSVSDYVRCK